MKYYKLYFDRNFEDGLVYSSRESLPLYVRVLAKLRGKLATAIVGEEVAEPAEFKCLPILEVLDDEPILSKELCRLAAWISRYYHYPFGMSLFEVLDSGAKVDVGQKVCKLKEKVGERLLEILPASGSVTLGKLCKDYGKSGFYKKLEQLEQAGYLRVLRSNSKASLKGKENYLRLVEKNWAKLKNAPKQAELLEYLAGCKGDVALAKLSQKFSYSTIKSLENKGLVVRLVKEKFSEIFEPQTAEAVEVDLTAEQTKAYREIAKGLDSQAFTPFFLYGKTGTGKTEVYFKAMKRCLQAGKSVLFLLPEISLTPLMLQRVGAAFPKEKIAVLHSGLPGVERYLQWKRAKEAQIVIGVRSAVFAPLQNLGLVVVDEEHEQTFKQGNSPFYNARDVALVRAQSAGASVILGSATPSLASWHNSLTGKYKLLRLENRPFGVRFPSVEILDLKGEKSLFTQRFKELVLGRLERKEQVIILQNRRGHSSYLQCRDCGELVQCPHCQVSLSYHSSDSSLRCHYCGFQMPMLKKCPACGNYGFAKGGFGTQRIEQDLQKTFPQAKILRVDSDTAGSFAAHKKNMELIEKGEVDIILGTQIVAKGLDFHNITLAVVLRADDLLNMPDFMAGERSFALLTQVAGRTGRGEKVGHFLLQTYNPENPCLQMVESGDFENYAAQVLESREILAYPPYSKMVRFEFSSLDEKRLKKYFAKNAELFEFLRKKVKILGPSPALISKLQKRYRYHLIAKCESHQIAIWLVRFLRLNLSPLYNIKLLVDVDPYSLS